MLYLDNSNDTSFSLIRHPNIKLFNFSTFFGHFWGQKSAPEPNESTNKIWKYKKINWKMIETCLHTYKYLIKQVSITKN